VGADCADVLDSGALLGLGLQDQPALPGVRDHEPPLAQLLGAEPLLDDLPPLEEALALEPGARGKRRLPPLGQARIDQAPLGEARIDEAPLRRLPALNRFVVGQLRAALRRLTLLDRAMMRDLGTPLRGLAQKGLPAVGLGIGEAALLGCTLPLLNRMPRRLALRARLGVVSAPVAGVGKRRGGDRRRQQQSDNGLLHDTRSNLPEARLALTG
jgi:hypothetical protein